MLKSGDDRRRLAPFPRLGTRPDQLGTAAREPGDSDPAKADTTSTPNRPARKPPAVRRGTPPPSELAEHADLGPDGRVVPRRR